MYLPVQTSGMGLTLNEFALMNKNLSRLIECS